ncbi:BrnT family toxin [Vibrio sp. qd031]|uniref:BrnT family toxin n=1 Tax=Vibrio sp. qd031 TaxID=1603038 RepID=UPI000A1205A0|nr:BrnT family toxin [Vibrio sp. qd031]
MVKFESDENKSRSNFEKHGVDFYTVQGLWSDSNLIENPVRTSDEPRYLVIGMLNGKHWSGVITYRGLNIRIISVRHSRKAEVNLYESA